MQIGINFTLEEAKPIPYRVRYFYNEAQAEEADVLLTPQDSLDSEACWELIRSQADYVPLNLDGRVNIQE